MNIITFTGKQLFGGCFSVAYSSLKSNDDVGQEKMEEVSKKYFSFIRNSESIRRWKSEKIEKYTFDFVKDIEAIPVTSSNINDIKEKLNGIAKICDRCRKTLITALDQSKIEKDLRLILLNDVIMT